MTPLEIEEIIRNDEILGYGADYKFIGFMTGIHFIYNKFEMTKEFVKEITVKSELTADQCTFITTYLINRGFQLNQIFTYKRDIIDLSLMGHSWIGIAEEIYEEIFER